VNDTLYRLLLFAMPRHVRADFGDDMVQMFRDHRRAVGRRPFGVIGLWLAAVWDVFVESARERLGQRRRTRHQVDEPGQMMIRLTWLADFRYGLRLVRLYPGTSLLAIATLALGIGANTAIFSVVDAVLLRQLPYEDPGRLVMLFEKRPAESTFSNPVSPADYLDWRSRSSSFEHMAGQTSTSAGIAGDGEPEQVGGAAVGWGFFEALKVRPVLGRTFQPEDEIYGRHRVVVMSAGLWKRRYGSDPHIVGRTIVLNGNPWQIIGVLPADFQFIDPDVELWSPLVLEGTGQPPTRALHQLDVYARLKPGVSLTQARDEMDRLGRQLEQEHPDVSTGHGSHVVAMRDQYVKPYQTSLMVLFAAVGFVLLIACVNVANLLLARAISRRREMSVRAALGASRGRLVAQALSESVALAIAGGAAGLGVAVSMLLALPAVMPARLSVVDLGRVHLDARLLLFTFGLSIATGIVFGLLPALQASKPDVSETLKQAGRSLGGVRRRARVSLVITEVALASLTLVGAGLVLRSFGEILSQPLGFDPRGRLSFVISVPLGRYLTPDARRTALDEIEHRVAAVPGVSAVGGISILPLSGGDSRTGVAIEGREPRPDDPPTRMHPRIVTPTYFEAMAIQLVKGRIFTTQDDGRAEPVVVISETAARRFWPGQDPIGMHLRFGGDERWRTIIGVVADVRHWGLSRPVNPMLYWPQAQAMTSALFFVAKSDVDPATLGAAIRAAVGRFDAALPVAKIRTMEENVAQSVESERAQTTLLGTFGVLALVLAVIGIYGVTAQLVTARVHEIGIRMSLGARPIDVLRQLLGEGLWQTIAGLAIGIIAGVYLMRLGEVGRAMLYNVESWDPLTIAGVAVLLLVASLAAYVIPARRAMRVDPVEALRQN
jgi:putative ABC transport system permease protein